MTQNDSIQRALPLYPEGSFYPVYDEEQGAITWHEAGYGGEEDAIPRDQVLIALAIQSHINQGANMTLQADNQGDLHLVLPSRSIPLAQVPIGRGIHPIYGFFDKRQHPDWRDICEQPDQSA
jgi:hypothetical protein